MKKRYRFTSKNYITMQVVSGHYYSCKKSDYSVGSVNGVKVITMKNAYVWQFVVNAATQAWVPLNCNLYLNNQHIVGSFKPN